MRDLCDEVLKLLCEVTLDNNTVIEAIRSILEELYEYIRNVKGEEDEKDYLHVFNSLIDDFERLEKRFEGKSTTISRKLFKAIDKGNWHQTSDAWNSGFRAVELEVVQPLRKFLREISRIRVKK